MELCRDEDPFLANRSSASVWLCGCRVASGTARGEAGTWVGGPGSGEGGGAGEGRKFREMGRGIGEQDTQLLQMCVHLGPWAQGSSVALAPVILTQGVWGGPRNLPFKQDSVDRGKGVVSEEH